jgi:hypothetical protein
VVLQNAILVWMNSQLSSPNQFWGNFLWRLTLIESSVQRKTRLRLFSVEEIFETTGRLLPD